VPGGVKFFIDNNLPPSWGPALTALARNEGDHTVTHIRDKFPTDIDDVDWINALASEGGWVIISGDVRISRNKTEREAWLRSNLVAFFLSKTWSNHKFWDKTWRIVRWWPQIIQQASLVSPPAGFEIPLNYGSGKFDSISLKT
jgi:hypothetical protein